jgi:hypothetical protein
MQLPVREKRTLEVGTVSWSHGGVVRQATQCPVQHARKVHQGSSHHDKRFSLVTEVLQVCS